MSDRCDRPGPRLGALAAVAALASCMPLGPAVPPPAGDGGTPCTLSSAVRADSVAIVAGACNPGCIRVAAGTSVTFVNQDGTGYLLAAAGDSGFELVIPPMTSASTPPLAAGTVVVSGVHEPSLSVTVFVE